MSARRRPRRSRGARAGRFGCAVAGLAVLLVLATAGVIAWLDHTHHGPPPPEACYATSDGSRWQLDPGQADNAALVAAVALRRGLPARAVTIALATSIQESKLRNLPEGDRDSLGLFQQRPSQGWGTEEQILDPVYSTGRFYSALVKVKGYATMPITEAAQAVQRSGFPDAYAQHEAAARAYASALTGNSAAALTCTLHPVDDDADAGSGPSSTVPATVVDRVHRDLGPLATSVAPAAKGAGPAVVVDTARLGDDAARLAWAVGQWGVATARPLGLVGVQVGDQRWDRDAGAWGPAKGPAVPAGQVRLELPPD
ncbi:hypothetical protein [Cellulomonas alba]|uniref:Heavy metal transporter n=1 Tax=Cellulomonas alba TaxID=3053467 RepID=A0ABT7SHK4_9CELL|nr:hypothetical protein [Cellulomonas alba]MDM7855669.1 hypothetical protein [Cellulomonas alba]